MHLFIRRGIGTVLIALVSLACGFFVTPSEEIAARILPHAEDLQMVSCELKEASYEYTGKAIEPEIQKVVFKNRDGKTVTKLKEDITIIKYIDNVECGVADVQIQIADYLGMLTLEDVFSIYPTKVANLKVGETTKTAITLQWDTMSGVEGYYLYKSVSNGDNYALLQQIADPSVTTYQDTQVEPNGVYYYKISAYLTVNGEILEGAHSDNVKRYTPLSTPVLTGVNNQAHNTLQVTWNAVPGAVGYQVFHADTADGEFTCIKEITDGSVTSYADATRECGIPAYYYVKACQALESENVYGDASNILSGKTTPNAIRISGSLSNDNTQVNLSWKKSTAAQGYEVYKSENGGSYRLAAKIENPDTLSWSDSGLKKPNRYSYRVRPYAVVKGQTITAGYSNTYVKEAIYEFNYTPGELSANIQKILEFQGTPYVYGGKTPAGWDCSGFTRWVMRECMGVEIPYSAAQQGAGGQAISKYDKSQWKPGDILAYTNGSRISHVAIYIGNGQMIHALNEKRDTFVQDVDFYERWDPGNSLATVRRYFN